jgi:hypothetical protein
VCARAQGSKTKNEKKKMGKKEKNQIGSGKKYKKT